jgi:hypothetical protein
MASGVSAFQNLAFLRGVTTGGDGVMALALGCTAVFIRFTDQSCPIVAPLDAP